MYWLFSSVDKSKSLCVTGSSLTGLKTSWFKNSGRKSFPQLLLVLATTQSIDEIKAPARVLRDRGVRIETVGIGTLFDGVQLKEIATHPAQDHVMAVSKYELLPMIRPLLTVRMCRGEDSTSNITLFCWLYPGAVYTEGKFQPQHTCSSFLGRKTYVSFLILIMAFSLVLYHTLALLLINWCIFFRYFTSCWRKTYFATSFR